MKTKTNFCGIFATAFIVTITFVIASCSQDDDYYDSNMYTLAEKMETRSGGDPGGEGGEGGEENNGMYCADFTFTNVLFKGTNSDTIFSNVTTRITRKLNDAPKNCVEYLSHNNNTLENVHITYSEAGVFALGQCTVHLKLTAERIIQNDTIHYSAEHRQNVKKSIFHPL